MTSTDDSMPSDRTAVRAGTPLATYRLQLHAGFDFSAACAVLPYLSALGVTHCYLSPVFRAVPGSTHGYDVCQHTQINPELGGEAGFEAFAEDAARHGIGVILDFVPNHMSNDPGTNDWWRNVLENGPSSPFARFFDVDWDPVKPELKDKLLLPILGELYGDALDRGALTLWFEDGALVLKYGTYTLPINPRQAPLVFEHDLAALEATLGADHPDLREFLSILTALRNLPVYTERDERQVAERHRETSVARDRLGRLVDRSPAIGGHIARAIDAFSGAPDRPQGFDRLHELLERQAYRLASWRTASDEINYRRFFDINSLAGLRVEDPAVFATIHGLLVSLVNRGLATGVRLDHVDGLYDPGAYLKTLVAALKDARGGAPGAAGRARDAPSAPYVVVEKILSAGETLRDDWPVAGTTGYTFMNEVNGVLIDRRRAKRLQRSYARITGRHESFADVTYGSKRLIVSTALSSEFQVLVRAVNRFSEGDRRYRDFTLASIERALRELVACFPVYRTYVDHRGATALDAAVVDRAIREARRRNPAMESSIFDFLRFVLLPRASPGEAVEADAPTVRSRAAIAMRFQQYTAPVQAKGLEDTAFYRYHVLASLNEVGGDPTRVGLTVEEFHAANAHRQRRWPAEMLATTTHDTKRSEDARTRIDVLSEVADEWHAAVSQWRRINAPNRTRLGGGQAPDPNDEHLFYQCLVGAWPIDDVDGPVAESASADLVARVGAYMHKAVKEAKLHTSWITPNVDYETAVGQFVERTLAGRLAPQFLASFVPFARRIGVAGAVNSLAQLVLKLASPGVPDFYQGTELWDQSLVDPDNRRPVDWELRRRLLASMTSPLPAAGAVPGEADGAGDLVRTLLASWWDGRLKLFVTALGLRWRRRHPAIFEGGDYVPLPIAGTHADHLVAFARRAGGDTLIAVVPRLTVSLGARDRWPTGEHSWPDTVVRLREASRTTFRNLITGDRFNSRAGPEGTDLEIKKVLAVAPVALLWAESGASID